MQNAISFGSQIHIAGFVAFGQHIVRMAVDLDDQLARATQEIGEERPDRHLAAKFHAELRLGEMLPQLAFRGCGGIAQLAGALGVAVGPGRHGRTCAHP